METLSLMAPGLLGDWRERSPPEPQGLVLLCEMRAIRSGRHKASCLPSIHEACLPAISLMICLQTIQHHCQMILHRISNHRKQAVKKMAPAARVHPWTMSNLWLHQISAQEPDLPRQLLNAHLSTPYDEGRSQGHACPQYSNRHHMSPYICSARPPRCRFMISVWIIRDITTPLQTVRGLR